LKKIKKYFTSLKIYALFYGNTLKRKIKKMKKGCVFILGFFIFVISANLSTAQEGNPFIAKKPNEFTLHDQKKMEEKITGNCNKEVSKLEDRINSRLKRLEEGNSPNMRRNTVAEIDPRNMGNYKEGLESVNNEISMKDLFSIGNNINPMGPGENIANIIPAAPVVKDPITEKIKNSFFIGCFDDQVLFRDNDTKEKFFLSLEEVENNEEFKKIGNCSN